MKRYRLMLHSTGELVDIEAESAQEACQKQGWLIGDVWVREYTPTRRDPHSDSGFRYSGWKNITKAVIK